MKNNNAIALGVLIKRNIKLYLKDGMTVFFSVLAPIIVLLLYILFLGKLQVSEVSSVFGDTIAKGDIEALINNWMVAGLMGVSCITVAINTNIVMLRDKASGNINDMLSSPVKRWVVYLSYIISCFIITFVICFIVLLVAIAYLAASGGLMMNFVEFLGLVGTTILSTLSSAFFMVLICSFLKSGNSLAALNSVFCTVIGFLIGAYLPFGMMPSGMKYAACFIPGTYSVGIFKQFFMSGCMRRFETLIGSGEFADIWEKIQVDYSLRLDFFGKEVSIGYMVLVLVLSIVIFGGLLAIFYSNKKTNFFLNHKKKKVKKSK